MITIIIAESSRPVGFVISWLDNMKLGRSRFIKFHFISYNVNIYGEIGCLLLLQSRQENRVMLVCDFCLSNQMIGQREVKTNVTRFSYRNHTRTSPWWHGFQFYCYICNTWRHKQNGQQFADVIFKYIFMNWIYCILINISLNLAHYIIIQHSVG